tara:strand:+ start:169338 stop:169856 length:519 start_codon:yes stop_codon:yes gene_type:complete
MGDMADAIIEGLFCEGCGQVIDGDSPGFPRKCNECGGSKPKSKKKRRSRGKGSQFVEVTLDQFHEVLKADKGWYLCEDNAHEHIFGWRPKSPSEIEIKVATTVNKGTERHRRYGKDAIRIWAIWCPEDKKNTHGLVKSVSIKRTDGWQKRLETKVLEVLQQARNNAAVFGAR